jgi:hypothetical protein
LLLAVEVEAVQTDLKPVVLAAAAELWFLPISPLRRAWPSQYKQVLAERVLIAATDPQVDIQSSQH